MEQEEYIDKVKKIDWTLYETAYGNAGKDIPDYVNSKKAIPQIESLLIQLFSDNHEEAMKATHYLWCSLCHQYSFISSAALPAFDFLMYGLKNLDNKLKVELLDIFLGFVVTISKKESINTWQGQLRQKVINEREYFEVLSKNADEDIAYFAQEIVKEIRTIPCGRL